jgi:hypothetical protein
VNKNKLPKLQRFQYLHKMAIQQKAVLDDNSSMKALKKMSDDTFLNEGKRLND